MAEGVKDILTWKDENGTVHVIPVDLVTGHDDDRTADATTHPVEQGANINDHVIQNPDTLVLEIAQTQTPFITPSQPGVAFSAPPGFSTQAIKLDIRPSSFLPAKPQTVDVPANSFVPGGLFALTQGLESAIGSLFGGGPDKTFKTSGMPAQKEDRNATVNVIVSEAPRDRIGELHDALIQVKQEARFCTVTFRGRVYPDFLMTRVGWKSTKGEAGLGRFTLNLQSLRIVATATATLPNPASLRLKPVVTTTKPAKSVGDPKPNATGGAAGESVLSQGTGGGASSS